MEEGEMSWTTAAYIHLNLRTVASIINDWQWFVLIKWRLNEEKADGNPK